MSLVFTVIKKLKREAAVGTRAHALTSSCPPFIPSLSIQPLLLNNKLILDLNKDWTPPPPSTTIGSQK